MVPLVLAIRRHVHTIGIPGMQGSSPGISLKQQGHVLAIMALQLHIADPAVPIQRRVCSEAIATLLGPCGLPGASHASRALVFNLVKSV